MSLRSCTENKNGHIGDRVSPLSNPSAALRAQGFFPIKGRALIRSSPRRLCRNRQRTQMSC